MGGQPSAKKDLHDVTARLSSEGAIQVTGRYHRLPKRLEDDYILESTEIGTGLNGSVYLAIHRCTGEKHAVKPLKLFRISKSQKRELRNEVEVSLTMDHPHVARLRDVYECETQLRIVMEYLEGGELYERLIKVKKFNEHDAREATYQILLALNYVHTMGIVHRDIKMENFLYDTKAYDHLKLIDFGLSRFTNNKKMKLGCGTLSYVAPEVLKEDYTEKCDLWSVGCVVFILLLGYMPFAGKDDDVMEAIKAGDFLKKPRPWSRLSEDGRSFLEALLTVNPQRRPSAEQALAHPWLQSRSQAMARSSTSSGLDDSIVDSLRAFAKASRFRRTCQSMMAWSLTNDQRTEVRSAFVELDHDKTGTITLDELKRVLEDKIDMTDSEVQTIFNALDSNSNEVVNYSDFLAAMMSTRIALHDDMVLETFKRFDVDRTGFISADNLREVLGSCYKDEEIETLISEADLSQDGQISFEEFVNYIHSGDIKESHREAFEAVMDRELSCKRHGTVPIKSKTNGASPAAAPSLVESDDQAPRERADSGFACTLSRLCLLQ